MNIELRAVETTLGRAAQLLGVRVRLAARFALRSIGYGDSRLDHTTPQQHCITLVLHSPSPRATWLAVAIVLYPRFATWFAIRCQPAPPLAVRATRQELFFPK